jgi:hypothetical protein
MAHFWIRLNLGQERLKLAEIRERIVSHLRAGV